MPVKPVPSAIGGLVKGVDVAAAGSVVVIGEGDAWRPEALGAPSKVGSCVRSCPCSSPSSASSPASFSLSLFLFTGWVTTSSTDRAPKAVLSPSRESSAASTGPSKGSEGTALPGAGHAGASGAGAVFTSASSFLVSIFSRPSAYMCLYSAHWMYGAGLLPVRRDRLPLATRKVYSGFSTVFLLLLLLAVRVGLPAACFGR